MFKETIVVIPTFNEEKNIKQLVLKIKEKFKNLIVIDNCSTDKTYEIIKSLKIIYTRHVFNLGKSMSMKTGLDYANFKKFKYIAFIDGDGQHTVEDLIKISNKIKKENLDAVIGYRSKLENLNLKKKIGTLILQILFKMLFKKNLKDIQSGLRIIKVDVLNGIKWKSKGWRHYFADAEISCKLIMTKKKIAQIPIKTIASLPSKGMNIIHGLYLITNLFLWRIIK